MPYMTPTYHENFMATGSSSWEEIDHIHTDRQTTRICHPSHSPPHNTRNFFFSIFPTPERSEGVGYKKWTKRNCAYYAEASEKGGEFLWSVRLYVRT